MTTLNELKREMKVIGKAKDIQRVRQGQAQSSGKNYLAYTLVVMVENTKTGTVDDIKVDFFSMEGSSPYNSQTKFLEGGKTIANSSLEEADIVSIAGRVELEEYVNKNGNHVVFNKLQGAFIHRLDEDMKHRAVANVETVITDIKDKLDDDDLPTGEKVLNGFTVGYKENIIVIKEAIVPKQLAEDFVKLYRAGQTAMLTYQFINRAIKEDREEVVEDDAPTAAFGAVADIDAGRGKSFTRFDTRTLIVGGLQPYDEDLALTEDEINEALKLREAKEKEVANSHYDVPAPPKKAVEKAENNNPFGVSTDDIPDF